MDSATPLELAPAGAGIAFAGQACPVSQGGGDTYPLFPGENRVAVATSGIMVKWDATKCRRIRFSEPVIRLPINAINNRSAEAEPTAWQSPVATGSPYSSRKNPSPSPPKNGRYRSRPLTVVGARSENRSTNRDNDSKKSREDDGVHEMVMALTRYMVYPHDMLRYKGINPNVSDQPKTVTGNAVRFICGRA